MNAFFKSQFSNYPLSWMLNNKINRLHERCLRIIYNGEATGLMKIYNWVPVHHGNNQILTTELYQFFNDLSPKLVSDCFKLNDMTMFNTRNQSFFCSRPVHTVSHGSPTCEQKFGTCAKNLSTFTAFKKTIRQ